jgi:uncharacterized membrane protein
MTNKIWNYGQENGLDRRLVLSGFTFIEDKSITVFLKEELLSPTDVVVSSKPADYKVEKGVISTDVNGALLPKKNTNGEIQYVLDEDGNPTETPLPRDNAFENIIYYIDNKMFTIYELIDAGVKEHFNLV